MARINPTPLFVLGNVKAGTTAVAALLARRAGLSVTLDIPALFEPTMSAISKGERSLASVVQENRLAFSRDVVQQGTLWRVYPQLRELFPQARHLMVVRDPRANVRSVLDRVGLEGTHRELGPEELASVPELWRGNLDPRSVDLPSGNYVATLARRWCLAIDTYLTDESSMLLVRYDDFVSDREGVIDETLSALDLRPGHDISEWLTQQFQPAGRNRDVPWLEFYGRENLTKIESICGSRMERLGYAVSAEVGDVERSAG